MKDRGLFLCKKNGKIKDIEEIFVGFCGHLLYGGVDWNVEIKLNIDSEKVTFYAGVWIETSSTEFPGGVL